MSMKHQPKVCTAKTSLLHWLYVLISHASFLSPKSFVVYQGRTSTSICPNSALCLSVEM